MFQFSSDPQSFLDLFQKSSRSGSILHEPFSIWLRRLPATSCIQSSKVFPGKEPIEELVSWHCAWARCHCHVATRTSAVTGNRSGLVKRFHGARQSRILAGDPLAGWKKKTDKLFVPRLRSTNSLSLFFFHPARGSPARILDCCANLAALASASLLQSNSSDWWLAVLTSASFCRNS